MDENWWKEEGEVEVWVDERVTLGITEAQITLLRSVNECGLNGRGPCHKVYSNDEQWVAFALNRRGLVEAGWEDNITLYDDLYVGDETLVIFPTDSGRQFEQWYDARGEKYIELSENSFGYIKKDGKVLIEIQETVPLKMTNAQIKMLRQINELPKGRMTNHYPNGTKEEKIGFALVRRGLVGVRYEPRLRTWAEYPTAECYEPEELVFRPIEKGRKFIEWLDQQE